MRRLATVLLVSVLTAVQTVPIRALAQPSDPQALEDARWQFSEGTAHFQGRRYAEAMAAFERSNAIVPSPNADLMIARCLRDLGKKVEAAAAFERAEKSARKRVATGEAKYGQTAEAAKTEGDKVKAGLGSIAIHVTKPNGSSVTVDGKEVALENGEATLLHEPGTAVVVVRDAGGNKQRQTITVNAGSSSRMDFAVTDQSTTTTPPIVGPPPRVETPPPKTNEKRGTKWTVPAAFVSGGVTLAGLGVFTGFGLSSKSTFDEISRRCGPSSCTDADRADADSGQRAQTIANVGLIVAAVAAVTTIIFIIESAD